MIERILAILRLAAWSAFSRPARALLLVATLGGGAAGVALTAGVLQGYAKEMERMSFGAYARSLVISENRFVDDRYGPPRLSDMPRVREALGADIEAVAAWRRALGDARVGVEQASLPVFGVRGDYQREADMPLVAGRALTVEETESAQRLCLLGAGAKAQLFSDAEAVGRRVRINGVSCEVIGVFGEANAQTAERYRPAILTPFIAAARYFEFGGLNFQAGPEDLERLTVVLRPGIDRDNALIAADRALRRAHGAAVSEVDPFVYADPAAPARSLARQRDLISRLLFAIAAVSVAVAVTGYAAATVAAVDMRRRDISLQMMSGATGRSILAQVLTEGLIFGALGALAGLSLVALGAGLSQAFIRFPFSLSPEVAVQVLLGGVIIGLLASLWPARRAASGSPALSSKV
jgi:putative ABC transport system permease protein